MQRSLGESNQRENSSWHRNAYSHQYGIDMTDYTDTVWLLARTSFSRVIVNRIRSKSANSLPDVGVYSNFSWVGYQFGLHLVLYFIHSDCFHCFCCCCCRCHYWIPRWHDCRSLIQHTFALLVFNQTNPITTHLHFYRRRSRFWLSSLMLWLLVFSSSFIFAMHVASELFTLSLSLLFYQKSCAFFTHWL